MSEALSTLSNPTGAGSDLAIDSEDARRHSAQLQMPRGVQRQPDWC